MKAVISSILSLIVFVVSFQHSLIFLDYQVHREFYEAHCINQDKPEMDCHGKCQAQKKTEESGSPVNVIKTGSFDFHFIASNTADFIAEPFSEVAVHQESHNLHINTICKGFSEIQPHPPRI